MNKYGIVLFYTTSAVMRAEKLLLEAGYSVRRIPTPHHFAGDCGIALRFVWAYREPLRSLLGGARVEFDAIHPLNVEGD